MEIANRIHYNYKANALQLMTGKNDIVGNLVTGEGLKDEQFDCVILTQTLPFIYDYRSAIDNLRRAFKTRRSDFGDSVRHITDFSF